MQKTFLFLDLVFQVESVDYKKFIISSWPKSITTDDSFIFDWCNDERETDKQKKARTLAYELILDQECWFKTENIKVENGIAFFGKNATTEEEGEFKAKFDLDRFDSDSFEETEEGTQWKVWPYPESYILEDDRLVIAQEASLEDMAKHEIKVGYKIRRVL